MPEQFSVTLATSGDCGVSLMDKIVGSVRVSTDRGHIVAHKLR